MYTVALWLSHLTMQKCLGFFSLIWVWGYWFLDKEKFLVHNTWDQILWLLSWLLNWSGDANANALTYMDMILFLVMIWIWFLWGKRICNSSSNTFFNQVQEYSDLADKAKVIHSICIVLQQFRRRLHRREIGGIKWCSSRSTSAHHSSWVLCPSPCWLGYRFNHKLANQLSC